MRDLGRLTYALDAASRDLPVLPLLHRDKKPHGGLAPHGVLDATTDPRVVRSWFVREPDINYGIAAGNGIVILDVDGRDAQRRVQELGVPSNLTVHTARGRHYYFTTQVPCRNGNNILGPGSRVNAKGEGGYVVGPGSTHPDGSLIEIEIDPEIAPTPAWLLSLLRQAPAVEPAPRQQGAHAQGPGAVHTAKDRVCSPPCS